VVLAQLQSVFLGQVPGDLFVPGPEIRHEAHSVEGDAAPAHLDDDHPISPGFSFFE